MHLYAMVLNVMRSIRTTGTPRSIQLGLTWSHRLAQCFSTPSHAVRTLVAGTAVYTAFLPVPVSVAAEVDELAPTQSLTLSVNLPATFPVSVPQAQVSEVALVQSRADEKAALAAEEAAKKATQASVQRVVASAPAIVAPSEQEDIAMVRGYIQQYAAEFGIDAGLLDRIAKCESGYRSNAKNRTSTASGVFQFIRGTWNGTIEGRAGLSPFNAEANVRAAARKISEGGLRAWNASKHCWSR